MMARYQDRSRVMSESRKTVQNGTMTCQKTGWHDLFLHMLSSSDDWDPVSRVYQVEWLSKVVHSLKKTENMSFALKVYVCFFIHIHLT